MSLPSAVNWHLQNSQMLVHIRWYLLWIIWPPHTLSSLHSVPPPHSYLYHIDLVAIRGLTPPACSGDTLSLSFAMDAVHAQWNSYPSFCVLSGFAEVFRDIPQLCHHQLLSRVWCVSLQCDAGPQRVCGIHFSSPVDGYLDGFLRFAITKEWNIFGRTFLCVRSLPL